ncbi:(2R)-3-sulfolactate dehydrogenase (NADP(+)) [Roseovarius sp. THAF9]|uniref:Ldh family oxidoreductase n=1 Tax=Roseovarius sp. THAF9 TaxID=2587847 RepID=UPI00126935A2|nr:Ldh family oxidoreductase [Roseovarius sp. THAF9]QFT93429.1 (2R)-3-sulfolactate dehydrogenase (NADP(+)) [Roseovarius sp. THAF9]
MQVSLDEIEATAKAALVNHGAEDWIAAEVAAAVREAEGLGNRICGLYYLESYCQQLRTGRVKGDSVPEVRKPRPGVVEVDAKFGFAQAAFSKALPEAARAAKEMGTISLAVCHAHTCTSLGYFTAQIARAGFIVLGMTNATPVVAPPDGKSRVIGTNPISFAVPDGKGGVAMLFDQSTTTVALGKITMAKAAGETIPEGWAVDAEGKPTTDPEAALKGSLVSMGGYKGWGFGLMAELLAAGMTGSRAGVDLGPLKAPEGDPHDIGDFYLIMDPDVSGGAFFDRLTQVSQAVQRDEGARMPGQARTVQDPVKVDPDAWALAQRLAGAD